MVRKLPNLARHLCSCVGPNGLVSEVELGLAGRRKGIRTTNFAIPLTWVTLLVFSSSPVAKFGYALRAVSNRRTEAPLLVATSAVGPLTLILFRRQT
jgi:hypothetical protein